MIDFEIVKVDEKINQRNTQSERTDENEEGEHECHQGKEGASWSGAKSGVARLQDTRRQ
jgi:hypothetical protein